MQAANLVCSIVILFAGCALAAPPVNGGGQISGLSTSQKTAIGRKIWQNECAGTVEGLTSWNAGEEFPSLGIGHFIWYPAGFKGRFEESWPSFVAFARQRGANPPAVALVARSPWRTKAEFQSDFKNSRMTALRNWLAGNLGLQTDFIIARSRAALPKILAAAPGSEKARIEANYRKVSTTSQGTYALIDYVNFKGDGTQVSERYNGRGWGLLQVLGEMKEVPAGAPAATEFAAAAKRVLSRRIANSPQERGEKRWEEGWHNRCGTYGRPL
jgi:hypothetical protein